MGPSWRSFSSKSKMRLMMELIGVPNSFFEYFKPDFANK